MQFMGVCPQWTPLDFRGPVPTGIFVGLSPLDFQGSVPTGFIVVCPHWDSGFPGVCPHWDFRRLSPLWTRNYHVGVIIM